jgi:hypothetical protein
MKIQIMTVGAQKNGNGNQYGFTYHGLMMSVIKKF